MNHSMHPWHAHSPQSVIGLGGGQTWQDRSPDGYASAGPVTGVCCCSASEDGRVSESARSGRARARECGEESGRYRPTYRHELYTQQIVQTFPAFNRDPAQVDSRFTRSSAAKQRGVDARILHNNLPTIPSLDSNRKLPPRGGTIESRTHIISQRSDRYFSAHELMYPCMSLMVGAMIPIPFFSRWGMEIGTWGLF
jgi:hypothetical protein